MSIKIIFSGLVGVCLCLIIVMQSTSEKAVALVSDSASLNPRSCWFHVDIAASCYEFEIFDSGHQFILPVVVLKADEPTEAAVLYLSGGPGGSTFLSAEDMVYWQGQRARLNLKADLVLVDRRGTGMAKPLLQCPFFRSEYRKSLTQNVTAQAESDSVFRSMSWCFKQQLSHEPEAQRIAVSALGTAADARDMQALLTHLNYTQWHLWGVSYGTRLALAIAAQQPVQLQSLVLDSVYPPGRGNSNEWPGLMNSAMNRFFHWCDIQHCAANSRVSSEERFQETLRYLDQHPLTLSLPSWYGEPPYRVVVNGQRYLQIIFGAIYDQHLWRSIGESLLELPKNKMAAISILTENFVNNAFDPSFSELVFYTAECKDNMPSEASLVDLALAQNPHYQQYLDGMEQWDVCQSEMFSRVRGQERLSIAGLVDIAVPVLMLSGELDPITPIEWVAPLHALLPHWQQASFAQVGHAVVSSDVCAEQLVADFIDQPLQPLALVGKNCLNSIVHLGTNLPLH